MTALQYVENILKDDWTSSISGRPHDVGGLVSEGGSQVRIVYESDKDWRSMDLSNYDYLTLRDGGIVDMEPQSFNWQEEKVVSRVDIDIRTKGWPNDNRPGRIALWGERGAGSLNSNEAPRWGGLVGEAMRVTKKHRGRDKEFDIIATNEADDLSAQMGGQIWRAMVSVQLDIRANQIDTST